MFLASPGNEKREMLEDIKERVHRYLINETEFLKVKDRMTEDQLRSFVNDAILDLCHQEKIRMEPEHRLILVRTLVSAIISLGPLRPLMEDKAVTEIMVNGYNRVYIQKEGRISLTDIKFDDNRHLQHTIHKLLTASGSNKRL